MDKPWELRVEIEATSRETAISALKDILSDMDSGMMAAGSAWVDGRYKWTLLDTSNEEKTNG